MSEILHVIQSKSIGKANIFECKAMYPIEPIKIRYTVPLEELIAELERDPEFKAELNQHLENIKAAHSERLRSLQGLALKTIEDCLNDSELPAKDRLAAAFKIIEISKINVAEPGCTNAGQIRMQNTLDTLLS